MNIILEGLVKKICLNYIDDILIFSENIEEHKQYLVTVEERLNEYNLKINEEKSQYNKSEIDFLGYKIGNDNIVPLLKRSDGILKYPMTNTRKKLMRFLGLINYDRN
ncbi:Transposon Ty3-I Gag-Pol polyprotein [Dictyocoela muelleri]|nr:Transposon Ty3-I Gag-Pol polyprotein [Dictyocoela muelleri]